MCNENPEWYGTSSVPEAQPLAVVHHHQERARERALAGAETAPVDPDGKGDYIGMT